MRPHVEHQPAVEDFNSKFGLLYEVYEAPSTRPATVACDGESGVPDGGLCLASEQRAALDTHYDGSHTFVIPKHIPALLIAQQIV